MKKIDTEAGEFTVYHVSEAGSPSAHDTTSGEWFFQPSDVSDGDVYSEAYPTEAEAEQAARDWALRDA